MLSLDEIDRFLNSARTGRFLAVFTVMYKCGLLLSEATRFKPGHIDSSRRVLRVVGGKTLKDREIPISGALDQQKWTAVQETRLLPRVQSFLVTLNGAPGSREKRIGPSVSSDK